MGITVTKTIRVIRTTITVKDGVTTRTVETTTTDGDDLDPEKVGEAAQEMHDALEASRIDIERQFSNLADAFQRGIDRAMAPFDRLFRDTGSKSPPKAKEPEK